MASYLKIPLVIVFKVSKRANAKVRLKVLKHMNIDKFLHPSTRVTGIPQNAILLQIGVGKVFIQRYKKQYKIK